MCDNLETVLQERKNFEASTLYSTTAKRARTNQCGSQARYISTCWLVLHGTSLAKSSRARRDVRDAMLCQRLAKYHSIEYRSARTHDETRFQRTQVALSKSENPCFLYTFQVLYISVALRTLSAMDSCVNRTAEGSNKCLTYWFCPGQHRDLVQVWMIDLVKAHFRSINVWRGALAADLVQRRMSRVFENNAASHLKHIKTRGYDNVAHEILSRR